MDTSKVRVELVVAAGAVCGESPIWDPESGLLLWTDTASPYVHSWDPAAGAAGSWKTDRTVRSVARGRDRALVLICADGVYTLEAGKSAARLLCDPERGRAGMMPDDGTVDPAGRLVFDTYNTDKLDDPAGSIYSVEPDGTVRTLDSGLKLPNGIAFSPDGGTMYVAEMFAGRILRYDYDPVSGGASGRRLFAEIPSPEGLPDGIIVDSEGFLWNARWGGWRIVRYTPDGKVDRTYPMPFATATCMGFGGPALEDLYISSATLGLSAEESAKSLSPGGLFVMRGAGRGMEEGVFGKPRGRPDRVSGA